MMDLLLKVWNLTLFLIIQNLLFVDDSEDSEIKIVDFGFARFKPTEKETMKTPCFTLHYAAPEVLRQAMNQNDEGYGSR